MDYKYDVVSYDKNIPATIMRLRMNSRTKKTELQWHREPELVYVVEGESECICNGESRIVRQDDFVLFNGEDVHLVRPSEENECELLCMNFSFEYIRNFCKSIDSILFDIDSHPEVRKEVGKLLKLISRVDDSNDYSSLIQISYVNKIYYLLLSHCLTFRRGADSANVSKNDFTYAKTALAFINENYKREIPLGEIASVVGLSPSYFSKYFKNVTKISFSEYLANLRLENAVQDMLTLGSSVSDAAMDNGFANVKSFITQCKRVYGCTPAQYKKKLTAKR